MLMIFQLRENDGEKSIDWMVLSTDVYEIYIFVFCTLLATFMSREVLPLYL